MLQDNELVSKHDRPYIMGLSIIAVFLFHLISLTNIYRHTSMNFFLNGYLGVDVFFVLSAYGLCFSFENNHVLSFYLHRIKRLFPLYPIFLLLVYLIFHVPEKLWESLLLQCSGLSVIKALETDAQWFTPSLICIYILFPVLYYIGYKCQKFHLLFHLIAVNLTAVCAHFLAPYISFENNFISRFPIIVCGVIIFFLYKNKRNREVLIFISLLLLETFALNNSHFLSMFMLLLVWLFKYIDFRPLYSTISFVGKYSFELYLAQTITTLHFMKVCTIENNYLMILASIGLTIPIFFIFIGIYKGFRNLIDSCSSQQ